MVRPDVYKPSVTTTPQRIEVIEQGAQYQATCTPCGGRRLGKIERNAALARNHAADHRAFSPKCATL